MDPTEAELGNMNTLEDVANWCGTTGIVNTTLLNKLGDPAKLRDIGFIVRPVWDRVVEALKVTEGDPPVERDLTPVESARIEVFRRVIFKRLGMVPDGPGSQAPAQPVVGATPFPATSSRPDGSPTKKLKLSSIIDPTLEADVLQLGSEETNRMYESYKKRFGAHPAPDVDPTGDQLAGLAQVIRAQGLPYCDFSLWGPHGLRTLRRAMFTSYHLNVATGEWAKREAPGPANLQKWEKCFRTYKAAMLLLEAADSERLDAYADFIRDLCHQFGPEAWGIIYQADVRMRSEFMDRVKRDLADSKEFGFTSANPWSAVFASAVRQADFWSREATIPCTLLLARQKGTPKGGDDDSSSQGAKPSKQPKKKRTGAKRYTGENKSKWDKSKGAYTHSRKGFEICEKFNRGACGNGKAQSRCPAGRSHQCNLCLGPHQASQCTGSKQD